MRSRRPVKFTREWGLPRASTPVSASNTSLARFSQASSRSAAHRNSPTWPARTGSSCPRRQPAASSTGITATAYMGHLIAARQSRPRSATAGLPSTAPEPPSPGPEAEEEADGEGGVA